MTRTRTRLIGVTTLVVAALAVTAAPGQSATKTTKKKAATTKKTATTKKGTTATTAKAATPTTAAPTATPSTAATSGPKPVVGGTLTWGNFIFPTGLDPIVSTGHLTTGFVEMQAVYDTVVRWNGDTGKYENLTAESVTPNADFSEWTVKIKPGIKFTDGTDYDAAAVAMSFNRHRPVTGTYPPPPCAETVSCPGNTTSSTSYMGWVKNVQVVDKLTMKVTLDSGWSGFPAALASEPGLVVSPTAIKKACPNPAVSIRTCSFNLEPVGAGPFMVKSFKPGEAIEMVRNPNYYGGQVYLDGIKFINSGDPGGMKTYDWFTTKTIDAGILRTPESVFYARRDKMNNFSFPAQSGSVLLLNAGININCSGGQPAQFCAGKADGTQVPSNPPTKNVNVRRAVQAAIDPDVIDQRANKGQGNPGLELFQSDFAWYSPAAAAAAPKYDLATAKSFVAAAKAQGWDGKVRLLFNNAPSSQTTGLLIEAMLRAAGMDPDLDISKTSAQTTVQYTQQRDFDITGAGLAASNDEGGFIAFLQNLYSTAASNRMGFKDAKVDAALDAIRKAPTDDAKKVAFAQLAEANTAAVGMIPYGKNDQLIVWSNKVHGLQTTMRDSVRFDKAWMDK